MACRYALASLILAAAMLGGAPASAPAQCRLCPSPTTERQQAEPTDRLSLQVSTTLDFGRLVLLGAGQGAATLLPSGERSASGTVATVSARAMVGSVTVRGEPGRAVRIEMPRRVDLHSLSGGRIVIDDIETDLPSMARLDGSGALTFRFGGRLTVDGDSEGEYRGDVPVTVEYL